MKIVKRLYWICYGVLLSTPAFANTKLPEALDKVSDLLTTQIGPPLLIIGGAFLFIFSFINPSERYAPMAKNIFFSGIGLFSLGWIADFLKSL